MGEWVNEAISNVDQQSRIVLNGNKIDLGDARVVSTEEIQKKAKELNISLIIETSAVTGEGIEQAFNYLAHTIIDYHLINKWFSYLHIIWSFISSKWITFESCYSRKIRIVLCGCVFDSDMTIFLFKTFPLCFKSVSRMRPYPRAL